MRVTIRRLTALQVLRLLLVAGVLCSVVAYAAWAWVMYREALRDGETAAGGQADRVRAEALHGFERQRLLAERALDAVSRTRSLGGTKAERPLHEALRAIVQRHPGQALWVFDSSGHALASSAVFPAPRDLDISDQDVFATVRNTPPTSGLASLTFGGEPSVGVALRMPDTAGGFSGLAVALVPMGQFLPPQAPAVSGTESEVALINSNGFYLLDLPLDRQDWSTPPRLSTGTGLFRAVRDGVDGVYRAPGTRDNAERMVATRRLAGLPLTALVSVPVSDVTAAWRAALTGGALVIAPIAALLIGITALAYRRATREHAAQAQIREALQRGEVAEEALRRAQRIEAMGQLTGGVAHDFNNLLQIMASSLVLVRMGPLDARQQRALDAIENAASRGESLTRHLLTFSRRQTVAPTPLELREQLPRFLDLMRHSLRGDIVVTSYVAPDLWPVHVDASELELAVLNLGVNARDAMPNGGALAIEARNVVLNGTAQSHELRGDFVVFTVSDTGCGIPPNILPKVFEPFVTTKDIGKGTGLGLSQVYGFAQQAGGLATIASTLGQGTAVTLFLPRSHVPVARAAGGEPSPGVEPVVVQGTRATILLVEDNLQIAEATSLVIEHLGFNVVHAADANAALEVLDRGVPVDLLFSDIIMPGGMTGLELAQLVRQHLPRLPIVLTTGYSGSARDAGAEDFIILRKPYNFSDFSDIVHRLLPPDTDQAARHAAASLSV